MPNRRVSAGVSAMDRLIHDEIYRFLFEHSFDAILLTNPNGEVYRANPAACKLLQRSEEEICQLGRAGVVDLEDKRLQPALQEREKNKQIKTELNFKRCDGTVFPVELSSTIFTDEEEKSWTVIIFRDMSIIREIESTRQQANIEAAYFASYDYLTGILNRRAFMKAIEQEIERTKREHSSLSLLLLDVDYFKHINDRFGHAGGDTVLKRVAAGLGEQLRPYDVLGRYGGDEFIICLPGTTQNEAGIIAERLRQHIEQSDISIDGQHVPVTISLGIASYVSDENDMADRFIARADKNLYIAKEQRNTVFGV